MNVRMGGGRERRREGEREREREREREIGRQTDRQTDRRGARRKETRGRKAEKGVCVGGGGGGGLREWIDMARFGNTIGSRQSQSGSPFCRACACFALRDSNVVRVPTYSEKPVVGAWLNLLGGGGATGNGRHQGPPCINSEGVTKAPLCTSDAVLPAYPHVMGCRTTQGEPMPCHQALDAAVLPGACLMKPREGGRRLRGPGTGGDQGARVPVNHVVLIDLLTKAPEPKRSGVPHHGAAPPPGWAAGTRQLHIKGRRRATDCP